MSLKTLLATLGAALTASACSDNDCGTYMTTAHEDRHLWNTNLTDCTPAAGPIGEYNVTGGSKCVFYFDTKCLIGTHYKVPTTIYATDKDVLGTFPTRAEPKAFMCGGWLPGQAQQQTPSKRTTETVNSVESGNYVDNINNKRNLATGDNCHAPSTSIKTYTVNDHGKCQFFSNNGCSGDFKETIGPMTVNWHASTGQWGYKCWDV